MSLDGSVYLVRLLEISSKEIVRDSKGPLWPRFGSDPSPPKVDGALVLHDTTQPAICSEIANLLGTSTRCNATYKHFLLQHIHFFRQGLGGIR